MDAVLGVVDIQNVAWMKTIRFRFFLYLKTIINLANVSTSFIMCLFHWLYDYEQEIIYVRLREFLRSIQSRGPRMRILIILFKRKWYMKKLMWKDKLQRRVRENHFDLLIMKCSSKVHFQEIIYSKDIYRLVLKF